MEMTRANNVKQLFAEIEKLTLGNSIDFATAVIEQGSNIVDLPAIYQSNAFSLVNFGTWGRSGGPGVDCYHVYAGEVVEELVENGNLPAVTYAFRSEQIIKYFDAYLLFGEAYETLSNHYKELETRLRSNMLSEKDYFSVGRSANYVKDHINKLGQYGIHVNMIIKFIMSMPIDNNAIMYERFENANRYTDYVV